MLYKMGGTSVVWKGISHGGSVFFKYTTFLNQYAPLGARIPSGVVLLALQAPPAKTSRSIVFGFLHYISRYEERLLLVHFGEDYEKYMGEGPVWFPRIRKR